MGADNSAWWERFFSGDNQLKWAALISGENPWSTYVLPWVEFAKAPAAELPIVLPRLDGQGRPTWYCAGLNKLGALGLREALSAFVGPSYSDFDGRSHLLDTIDSVEAAFAEGTVPPVYLIRPSQATDVVKIRRVLELYRGLLCRMPKRQKHTERPLGSLRAELDRALVAGDEAGARHLLERIRRVGRLDAENLLFLEIGVRAGLGHWRDIAEDAALLSQLTGLRLPPRVLADVHEALYRVYVEPSEDINAPDRALEAFRSAGLPRRSALFGSRRGLRTARVVKSFFLYELARDASDQTLLAALTRELEQLNDQFANALAGLQTAREVHPATDPLRAADEAFDELEVERALELYLQASPSRKQLTRLIRCAEDIDTTDAARRVVDAIKLADYVDKLPTSWADRLSTLERIGSADQGDRPPQGWLDWARQVGNDLNAEAAMRTLREHQATWSTAALTQRKEVVQEITRIINNATGPSEEVFREAAPLLYMALVSESGAPPRQSKSLLQILVTKVVLLSDPSQNELELARDLAATLLTVGLDAVEYRSLVSDLEDLMGTQMSVFTLGWSLDLAELLAIHACPDPERRLRFLVHVIDQARRMAHRVSTTDALVIEQLCNDLSIDYPTELTVEHAADVSGPDEALSGKKVGIYTLVEQAGQRAASLLGQLCPTVRVELNSDHECTKRLANLARSADLFIFAWKSSKHQAFYCVKDHRDAVAPMIQAQGKGSSSILRAVFEAV